MLRTKNTLTSSKKANSDYLHFALRKYVKPQDTKYFFLQISVIVLEQFSYKISSFFFSSEKRRFSSYYEQASEISIVCSQNSTQITSFSLGRYTSVLNLLPNTSVPLYSWVHNTSIHT
uniref:Uncharacterized protein n=1 Tax=Cacopsylla melanoneura TaxID=428564 RepID=A0A8D8LK31_9HEMI